MQLDTKPEKKTFSIPDTTGGIIDRMVKLKADADKLEAKVKPLDEEYAFLEDYLIDNLPKVGLMGASGKKVRVEIKPVHLPTAKDWVKIYAYIKRNSAWELLHKRLSTEACRERWDAKKVIPGVEIFTKLTLKMLKK